MKQRKGEKQILISLRARERYWREEKENLKIASVGISRLLKEKGDW
jgi:hypothetical protein